MNALDLLSQNIQSLHVQSENADQPNAHKCQAWYQNTGIATTNLHNNAEAGRNECESLPNDEKQPWKEIRGTSWAQRITHRNDCYLFLSFHFICSSEEIASKSPENAVTSVKWQMHLVNKMVSRIKCMNEEKRFTRFPSTNTTQTTNIKQVTAWQCRKEWVQEMRPIENVTASAEWEGEQSGISVSEIVSPLQPAGRHVLLMNDERDKISYWRYRRYQNRMSQYQIAQQSEVNAEGMLPEQD